MGIFDFVTDSTKELAIARPDTARHLLVYKHPDKTIPHGAQLTVFADEVALFFKDGQYIDQLGPGRHKLEGDSLPFLGRLVDKFTDGNLWMASVYFVSTREFTGLKFGGSLGGHEDPESKLLIRLRMHGTYSMKVVDPARLLIGAIGTGKDGPEITTWLDDFVITRIMEFAGESIRDRGVPLLDVTSGARISEIQDGCLAQIANAFGGYGIDIVRFGKFNISMDAEDRALLQEKRSAMAEFNMAGDKAHAYAQFQQTMGLAEGLRSGNAGGALAGAGIGAGFGMANMMAQQFAPPPRGAYGAPPGYPPPGYPPAGYAAPAPQAPPAAANMIACPGCTAQVPPGKFCSSCGTKLPAPGDTGPQFCTNCGTKLGGKFCGSCGTAAP